MRELRFESLELQERPVFIGDKEYVLREASGAVATEYRNAVTSAATLSDDEYRVGEVANAEPLALSRCLFRKIEQPDGGIKLRPVELKVIQSWPSRLQSELFDALDEMSHLKPQSDLKTLQKQRERLDRQIAKLEKDENPTQPSLGSTTDGSESLTE